MTTLGASPFNQRAPGTGLHPRSKSVLAAAPSSTRLIGSFHRGSPAGSAEVAVRSCWIASLRTRDLSHLPRTPPSRRGLATALDLVKVRTHKCAARHEPGVFGARLRGAFALRPHSQNLLVFVSRSCHSELPTRPFFPGNIRAVLAIFPSAPRRKKFDGFDGFGGHYYYPF